MNKIIKFALVLLSTLGLILGTVSTSFSKVEGDKIILGAAVSLTGKYSSNGVHTQNGYNMAVDRINSMGGVKVGGKLINLTLSIMMMNQILRELLNLQKD